MIEIYKAGRTDLEFNGDMILNPTSCILSVELNGNIDVELIHEFDEEGRWESISNGSLLKIPYPFKEPQFFRIYNVDKTLDSVYCQARHLIFDLLDYIILDTRPTSATGQQALNAILANTPFKGYSDITKIATAYYIRKLVLGEALLGSDENSFVNRWGGEMDVDNFNLYFNQRVGSDHQVTFEYGKNLMSLDYSCSVDDVVTRIIPVGYDGITIEENYVDSPLIQHYPFIKSKVVKFDSIKVSEDDAADGYPTLAEAQKALKKEAQKLFDNGADKPLINIKVEGAQLENTIEYSGYYNLLEVGIGDTVAVKHHDLGIDIETRVLSYQYDCLLKKNIKVEIGNFQERYLDQQNKLQQMVNQITNSDGSVNASEVSGFINAQRAKLGAQREIAEKQHVRAIIFEDLNTESPTYGCCAIGTAGLEVSNRRSSDGRSWIFDTAITGGGIIADRVVTGILASLNGAFRLDLDKGEFSFSSDGEVNGTTLDNDGLGVYRNGIKTIKLIDGAMHVYNSRTGEYMGYYGTINDELRVQLFGANKYAIYAGDDDLKILSIDVDRDLSYGNATVDICGGILLSQRPGQDVGINGLVLGNDDRSDKYGFHNMSIRCHNSMGIQDNEGLTNGFYDARRGRWVIKGGLYQNTEEPPSAYILSMDENHRFFCGKKSIDVVSSILKLETTIKVDNDDDLTMMILPNDDDLIMTNIDGKKHVDQSSLIAGLVDVCKHLNSKLEILENQIAKS